MRNIGLGSFLVLIILSGCTKYPPIHSDKKADKSTRELYQSIKISANKGMMVGHEDALAYGINNGVEWWADSEKCDMYAVSGEYPAVYGWDIGDIHKQENLDSIPFADMISLIKQVHEMGGINTISWHIDNPVSGASSWNKSSITRSILPEGVHHQKLLDKLDFAADFLNSCKIGSEYIPIIFRPFHEHNGDWFWWGKGNTTEQEYVALWRFVADYFKEKHDIHHLIYAYSPDRSRIPNPIDSSAYYYAYPGHDYVDILGIDNYHNVRTTENDSTNKVEIQHMVDILEYISDEAEELGKVAAFTETGFETIPDSLWFTTRILNPILSSEKAKRIAYVLMWRNGNVKHHYLSYPGHPSEQDFKNFISHPFTLTQKDLAEK